VIEQIVLIVGLLFLTALDLIGVAARAAYLEASNARLLAAHESGDRRVERAIALMAGSARMMASLNLTLLLARLLLAGGFIYLFFGQLAPENPWWAALGLIAVGIVLFLFEWISGQNAGREAEQTAIRLAGFVQAVQLLTWPIASLALAVTREQQKESESTGAAMEEEFRTLVDAGEEEGVFEIGERRMIYSIIELGDTLAREIMVPRIDMLALEVNTPLAEAVDAFLNSGHSRVPVYEETIDNLLGLLYAKDLLRVWREGGQLDSLRSLLRPAHFIPEAKKVNELLAEMQSRRIHMAVVVDEYGGIAGLVTLEDIVEEILGEIQDEYDQAEELPYQALKEGGYLFLGRIDLNAFNEVMGSELPKDEADTLGGYLYSQLGHVPEAGEIVQTGDLLLTIEQVSARRIRSVKARWAPEEQAGQEESKHADE
jgi:CBS domain containing-hemolysin-like protein